MIDFDEQDAYMREMQYKQPYESEVQAAPEKNKKKG